MFEALTRIFAKPEAAAVGHDPKLAVAALLVHLAAVDGQATDQERSAVKEVLQDQYGLDEPSVDTLIRQAMARDADAVDLYNFTSALSGLDSDERIEIIRMMWLVVFADKKNHELEDNMVWRIAELIGVSSRDRTILRNQIGKQRAD
ncbi:TerB family tellurite resistance protein [Devosia rhodophyticola]|uniref:TerB family tellurite resistance protein n=1 Tax=Devosia rhodophyticola TaxID=3026423 RepID=A0ABY7YTX8_9HYPH|nr:TerB family tellurite resistance protein [Devosia rhodophyticola]WDR04419.1 TerB family tellurite resistance protein [Devosia rhodophyticola]